METAAEGGKARTTLHEGSWHGSPCFVVLGGPSLKGFDWSLVRPHLNTVVVNRAYRDLPHASIFFTEDIQFIEKFSREPDWKAFAGLKVFHALDPIYESQALACDPEIHIVRKVRPDKFWSKSFAEGLSYSSNSGIGALNIADLMGANPIIVLGLDCVRTAPDCENYHDDYPREWRVNGAQLESFASDFEHWAAPNLRHRDVINLNEMSGVKCWPRRDRDEFFRTYPGGIFSFA